VTAASSSTSPRRSTLRPSSRSSSCRSSSPRILVVGAGPAALSIATVLACHGDANDLEVVDPSGGWMTAWRRRFAAQAIAHLRSPAVHHPHPDPFALLAVTDRGELTSLGGTSLPSTRAFAWFCDDLVHRQRLTDAVVPAAAIGLHVTSDGTPIVHLDDGTVRRPGRMVIATNARQTIAPTCVRHLVGRDPRVATAEGGARVQDTPAGGHVVVVGGGLSAGHLAAGRPSAAPRSRCSPAAA
jgi:hypothetical protein